MRKNSPGSSGQLGGIGCGDFFTFLCSKGTRPIEKLRSQDDSHRGVGWLLLPFDRVQRQGDFGQEVGLPLVIYSRGTVLEVAVGLA